MTRGKTRVLMGILALALVMTLAAPAYALGPIDTEVPGSIQVSVDGYQQDLAGTAFDVWVYKLASVNAEGVFTPEAGFETLAVEQNGALWNGGVLGDELVSLPDLMAAAEDLVWGTAEAPAEPEEPAEGEETEREPALQPTFTASVDVADGTIELAAYGQGLYLLMPQEAQTALWEYTFNPILVAVPSVEQQNAEGETGIPSEGQWRYDVPVHLKAERENRLTGIVIEKTLQEYNASLGSTSFLFEVTAVLDGETVYSNVVSLTFSGPGTQSVTVEGIPAGAHVTVTEVYSGGSYAPVNGSVDIEQLAAPAEGELTRVAFTNTYTNERIPDGSVVNRYVYDGTGWDHQEVAGQ